MRRQCRHHRCQRNQVGSTSHRLIGYQTFATTPTEPTGTTEPTSTNTVAADQHAGTDRDDRANGHQDCRADRNPGTDRDNRANGHQHRRADRDPGTDRDNRANGHQHRRADRYPGTDRDNRADGHQYSRVDRHAVPTATTEPTVTNSATRDQHPGADRDNRANDHQYRRSHRHSGTDRDNRANGHQNCRADEHPEPTATTEPTVTNTAAPTNTPEPTATPNQPPPTPPRRPTPRNRPRQPSQRSPIPPFRRHSGADRDDRTNGHQHRYSNGHTGTDRDNRANDHQYRRADRHHRNRPRQPSQRSPIPPRRTTHRNRWYSRSVDMRYRGQRKELPINVPNSKLAMNDGRTLHAAFERAYKRVYHRTHAGHPIEALAWRLAATGPAIQRPASASRMKGRTRTSKPRHWRSMLLPGAAEIRACAVFSRYDLTAGMTVRGPAVIEEPESTTVIGPRESAAIDGYGNLVIELPYERTR